MHHFTFKTHILRKWKQLEMIMGASMGQFLASHIHNFELKIKIFMFKIQKFEKDRLKIDP